MPAETRALLLAALLLGPVCPAQEADEDPGPDGRDWVRIISYNVQFLPGPARIANRRGEPGYRAGEIGRLMAGYDIVALNETFDRGPRERILERLSEAWGEGIQRLTGPHPEDLRFGGGLLLATRLPILHSHTLIYSMGSRFRDHGFFADGFAAKGVLHARLARKRGADEDTLDVFVTHLEARDPSIREAQIGELVAFVERHAHAERPALLLGDLNTSGDPAARRADDSPYRRMMARLGAIRPGAGWLDLWPTLRGEEAGGTSDPLAEGGGRRIDYLLLAPGPAGGVGARDVRVRPFLDERVRALSDHAAVESILDWPRGE